MTGKQQPWHIKIWEQVSMVSVLSWRPCKTAPDSTLLAEEDTNFRTSDKQIK